MTPALKAGSGDRTVPAVVVAGEAVGLAVVRALGWKGVPVIMLYHDKYDMGYVSRFVKKSIQVPDPLEAESDFIDTLVKLSTTYKGAFLVPASDESLAAISRHKKILEPLYVVACTGWEITRQFIEKKCTYELADSVGVPAPRTVTPRSEEEAEAYGRSGEFPCLVKPSEGHRYSARFHKKMVMADNVDQMMSAYREAAAARVEVMLQEYIPGDDDSGANYNSYIWDGETLAEFTAAKVRNAPPQIGSPRVAVSKYVPEVIDSGRRILRALGFYGYACTEFKRDARDGEYKLMEVNGRHNMSSLLSTHCGLNFPWMHYRHLVYGERPSQREYRTGVYWIDLVKDAIFSIRYYGKERYSLQQYIEPYLRPHVFAELDPDDPKPFMQRCLGLVMKAIQRRG